LKGGTFEIQSLRTGNALELAIQGAPVGGGRGRGGFGGRGGGAPATPIPNQDVAQVSQNWPNGDIDVRLGNYMVQAQQKWTITPVAVAGGYPGSPYFKITVAGTDRALAATEDGELVAVPTFSGEPEQLWRIDQLTDGTYRIMPKQGGKVKEPLALSAIGASSVNLARFKPESQKMRWLLKSP
jgi:arabinan endo-1,5-alpha-L-arabinosidase